MTARVFHVTRPLDAIVMRWPLRYQIMVPMASVMLLAVLFVAGVGTLVAVHETESRIDAQIQEVARIAARANFPLTSSVLRQMKALSGAEMIVSDESGRTISSSGLADEFTTFSHDKASSVRQGIFGSDRVEYRGANFFHVITPLRARDGESPAQLHILFPEVEYDRAWQREVYPLVGLLVISIPVVLVLSGMTASRIAGRIGRLHQQVDRIADGEFQQFDLPPGDDEIRSLALAVNRMAGMLAEYEEKVRTTERMRTLAHLGGGIAHQLRNSATGCAMAVDLHAGECPLGAESESLVVAKRQLRLMEQYIQRFLQLGKPSDTSDLRPVDLASLVDDLMPLVAPSARHAGVQLTWTRGDGDATVTGDAERLGQLVINLLINAVEAVAHDRARSGGPAQVRVELSRPAPDRIRFLVADTGSGPPKAVAHRVFEPFVTEKPDGVGLGLSVAREIAEQHGGKIAWRRVGNETQFTVELPRAKGDGSHLSAEVASAATGVEKTPVPF
jgi:signal transduction histidine kinase